MFQELPELGFLSLDSLLIHERHDDQRTLPLVKRIQASGILRDPPIVSPLQDGSYRYIVLDGANRVTALRMMACPHALVQIVQPDDPGLKLHNWNHVVWELNPQRFLRRLRGIRGLELIATQGTLPQPQLTGECDLAVVRVASGESFSACSTDASMVFRVQQLNNIVDSYRQRARLDRINTRDIDPLIQIYPHLAGLVIFPHFEIREVMQLAGDGHMLPSGITRFTISPRALHLDYPMEELAAEKPLEEKNSTLDKWLKERLARKGVRYYAEATYLFDE